jgi:hypothetical protein
VPDPGCEQIVTANKEYLPHCTGTATVNENRSLLGMSVQRALLGQVSPQLRGVAVDEDGQLIRLRFFINGPVSDDDTLSASEVETELLADLSSNRKVDTEVVRLDTPQPLPDSELWVFQRRE